MVKDISDVFSSSARFLILQKLALLDCGLRLRELERATNLNIRSVQLATESLVKDRIIRKSKGIFIFNPSSPFSSTIKKIFYQLNQEQIEKRSSRYSERARYVINLSEEVSYFIRNKK